MREVLLHSSNNVCEVIILIRHLVFAKKRPWRNDISVQLRVKI